MWLRAARKEIVRRGLAAVLAVLVCGGALNWGHAGGDDPDCNPVLVHHDHHAHRFAAAPSTSSSPADHCYICHSLRLLQTGLIALSTHAVLPLQSTSFRPVEGVAAYSAFGVAGSSRGPPSVSL